MKTFETAIIIDDDADLCLLLKSVLKKSINEIYCAHTLEKGKQLVKDLEPDVIFLDNNFPDGEGLNLIREIKNSSPTTYLIFITAVEKYKQQALEYGADAFLEKPLTYSSIYRTLNYNINLKATG